MNDRIRELAGQAGFDTEHYKWIFANDNAGEGECHELLEKFAELIIQECIDCCGSQADHKSIRKCFGISVENNVKYPGPEAIGHLSQYERKYNIPDNG